MKNELNRNNYFLKDTVKKPKKPDTIETSPQRMNNSKKVLKRVNHTSSVKNIRQNRSMANNLTQNISNNSGI